MSGAKTYKPTPVQDFNDDLLVIDHLIDGATTVKQVKALQRLREVIRAWLVQARLRKAGRL